MVRNIIALSVMLLLTLSAQTQNPSIDELLLSREKEFQIMKSHRDTIKVRTWVNVVTLNGLMEKVIRIDSLLIAACLDELSKVPGQATESQLIDTIARLKGRIEYLKMAPPKNAKFLTPKDYLILLVLSFTLFLVGIFALLLLRRLKKANLSARESREELESARSRHETYEKKLEDISYTLSDFTDEHEKTLAQISELNKALISEKQQLASYREQYDAMSKEKENLKAELEKIRQDMANQAVHAQVPAFSPELITENNLLKSENMQARQRINELEETIDKLKSSGPDGSTPGNKALNNENEVQSSRMDAETHKLKSELQKSEQTQFQMQDKIKDLDDRVKALSKEKDHLRSERDITMETVKTLRDKLEQKETALFKAKEDSNKLEEAISGKLIQKEQIETLHAEIRRWQSENELLKKEIAQEIKLRRDIEEDVRKIFSRLGSSSTD
jgi:septal ring factor EnvC (AmiA/AmiB activator)